MGRSGAAHRRPVVDDAEPQGDGGVLIEEADRSVGLAAERGLEGWAKIPFLLFSEIFGSVSGPAEIRQVAQDSEPRRKLIAGADAGGPGLVIEVVGRSLDEDVRPGLGRVAPVFRSA